MQLNLLNSKVERQIELAGLQYFPNFISEDEENELIEIIDNQSWLNDLKRRIQHYGWKYDYKARAVTVDLYLGKLPDWLQIFADNLHHKNIFEKTPDQVIINEYQVSQGISAHIDCVPCFGDRIASLSLGSDAVMEFINPATNQGSQQKIPVLLEQRSLVLLTGDVRYKWQHAIPARKIDKYNGEIITRKRRLSLTFREVML